MNDDLDARYGHPEFTTIVPICSVCKHYSNFECMLHKDTDNKYKYGKSFDCNLVDYDKSTISYKWYCEQEKRKIESTQNR